MELSYISINHTYLENNYDLTMKIRVISVSMVSAYEPSDWESIPGGVVGIFFFISTFRPALEPIHSPLDLIPELINGG
jgi:hypothetical protein